MDESSFSPELTTNTKKSSSPKTDQASIKDKIALFALRHVFGLKVPNHEKKNAKEWEPVDKLFYLHVEDVRRREQKKIGERDFYIQDNFIVSSRVISDSYRVSVNDNGEYWQSVENFIEENGQKTGFTRQYFYTPDGNLSKFQVSKKIYDSKTGQVLKEENNVIDPPPDSVRRGKIVYIDAHKAVPVIAYIKEVKGNKYGNELQSLEPHKDIDAAELHKEQYILIIAQEGNRSPKEIENTINEYHQTLKSIVTSHEDLLSIDTFDRVIKNLSDYAITNNNQKVLESTAELIHTVLPYFSKKLQQNRESPDPSLNQVSVKVLQFLSRYVGFYAMHLPYYSPTSNHNETIVQSIGLLSENKDLLQLNFAESLLNKKYPEALTPLLILSQNGSIENSQEINNFLDKTITKLINQPGSTDIVGYNQLLQIWHQSLGDSEGNLIQNVNNLCVLENLQPGSIKRLINECGIYNFARYPIKLLLEQLKSEDSSKPYGLVVYPRNDWNGAFYTNGNVFGNLYEQIKDTHTIKIVECEGKLSALQKINKLRKKFGEASFSIIGGHGSPESIQFGNPLFRDSYLSLFDIVRSGFSSLKKSIYEKGTVILVSCSTGMDNGVAQNISDKLGLKVIAPDIPTNVKDIKVTRDNQNNLQFKVDYHESGVDKLFVSGQKVSQNIY